MFQITQNIDFGTFIRQFPQYKDTLLLDELRGTDYSRLDASKQIYLDFTGGSLYADRQINAYTELLKKHVYGNPHSNNPASQRSNLLVEETRASVLDYFNADKDYLCIFTANATGALKIVGECYPFGIGSFLLLSLDNHNSVNGIREYSKNKGGRFRYTPVDPETLQLDEDELMANLQSHPGLKNKLFAYPAQSNVSGIKHPLKFVETAQQEGWDVLLDTAAFVATNRLDLQLVRPDFATVSFYKIFGYPTGLGCLLVRTDKFEKLTKPWYAGGTIGLSAATYDGHYLLSSHERFEDGTINYLNIPAVKIGLSHIEAVGMNKINTRVRCLTAWLLQHLEEIKYPNGRRLIRIFGTKDISVRGGTIAMNFYDKNGQMYPPAMIESEAIRNNILLRTGCFCNPGLDETNNGISFSELENYFTTHQYGNFFDMINYTGKQRGSVRISLGLVSNFADALGFYRFAERFVL